jgi:pimeloyl-ACP methyl ester carboxylesterase
MTGQPAGPTRLLDLGGTGPIVHLAHANGFPPGTYRPLAEILTGQPVDGSGRSYHVIALPSRPLWPGSLPDSAPSWHPLADDLIRGLDDLGLSGIVGVGHSLGGVLTLWAAVRRPDLFRAVVLGWGWSGGCRWFAGPCAVGAPGRAGRTATRTLGGSRSLPRGRMPACGPTSRLGRTRVLTARCSWSIRRSGRRASLPRRRSTSGALSRT